MIFKREPALILGLVQTVLALVLAFGVSLSSQQTGAILAVTAAVLALITRRSVYSPATVAADAALTLEPVPGTQPGPTPQGGPQGPDEV